jgi:hypothetical protein
VCVRDQRPGGLIVSWDQRDGWRDCKFGTRVERQKYLDAGGMAYAGGADQERRIKPLFSDRGPEPKLVVLHPEIVSR